MGPEYYFVRDESSSTAHHWDYYKDRAHYALCGHMYQGAIRYEGPDRPKLVCRKCQDALPAYEARVWQDLAESLNDKYIDLQIEKRASDAKVRELERALKDRQSITSTIQGRSSPPHYFVRDSTSEVAHHWSYLKDEEDTALCGRGYEGEIVFECSERPPNVCGRCEALLPRYEAKWWREAASSAELARRKFQRRADLQYNEFKRLRKEYDDLSRRYAALLEQTSVYEDPSRDVVNLDGSDSESIRDPLLDLIDE